MSAVLNSHNVIPPDFWGKAKLSDDGTLIAWLPLIEHCRDVALTFRLLVELPTVFNRLQRCSGTDLTGTHLDRLAVIAFLHDMGKCNLGFQDKILRSNAPRVGHVREIAPLLNDLAVEAAGALQIEVLSSWFDPPSALEGYMRAAWSHHGTPVRFDSVGNRIGAVRWWKPAGERDPVAQLSVLVQVARDTFPRAFEHNTEPLPTAPQLQHRFAGLLMLADWLASHESFFPIERKSSFDARNAAKCALRAVGLENESIRSWHQDRAATFRDIFSWEPYPFQTLLSEMQTSDECNRLLIAEAETGSGKTEAALARFFALFAAGQVDSLYFALPTRVAARQLYERVCTYVQRAFEGFPERPPVILAVPGYVRVDNVRMDQILPSQSALWQDDSADRLRERMWAAERPKRFLAAPIAVGTIDQALMSALQVPHAHLRSVCLDRSLLVVDEVHASDTYMRSLLAGLVEHHIGTGGHALLLSATLGSSARAKFTGKPPPGFQEACEVPYPSVTDRDGTVSMVPSDRTEVREKSVHVVPMQVLWDMSRIIPEVALALRAGARVIVILNTVSRAMEFHRELEQSARVSDDTLFACRGVACPHHGRFAPSDREILDAAVTTRLGRDTADGPCVIVGTQTLEQSLDIDADLMITDLCPMDVLLQRIGRLHRHERNRPEEYSTPRCLVMVPDENDLSIYLDERGKPNPMFMRAGLGSVYEDVRMLQLTLDELARGDSIVIPYDNRRLVETATHHSVLESLPGSKWANHAQRIEGLDIAERVHAQYHLLTKLYTTPFDELVFHDPGEPAHTRLGLNDLRVSLDQTLVGPFSSPVSELVIPGHMASQDSPEETATVVSAEPDEFIVSHSGRRYRYSRFGLELIHESPH